MSSLNYYLFSNGLMTQLLTATQSVDANQKGTATIAYQFITNPSLTTINFDDPLAGQLLPALVSTGIFTQDVLNTALDALTNTYSIPWKTNGLGELVTQSHLNFLPYIQSVQSIIGNVQSFYQNSLNENLNPLLSSAFNGTSGIIPTFSGLLSQYGNFN